METIHTTFGDHGIQVELGSRNLVNLFQFNYPSLSSSWNFKPDMTLHIEDGYGIPFVNYKVAVAKTADQVQFRRADYLIEANGDYHHARISVHDELALKHALINFYSAYIIRHNWGLLLHSSCAVDKLQAHLFAGPSGAGKSTAAELSKPRQILSDEATLIKVKPNEIMVYNSPFRSEMRSTGEQAPCALASIQILKQSPCHNRTRIAKSDAFMQLMDKVFYWEHHPEETKKIFYLLHQLVDKVPVYELQFQKNNAFWELIS